MLRILTQTIIVPTFVTDYLCSGCFFSPDKFRLFNKPFLTVFLNYHSKSIVVLSLNLERYFTCDHFSLSYECIKVGISANLGQLARDIFRSING